MIKLFLLIACIKTDVSYLAVALSMIMQKENIFIASFSARKSVYIVNQSRCYRNQELEPHQFRHASMACDLVQLGWFHKNLSDFVNNFSSRHGSF